MGEPELVWDIQAELGEGPVWSARERCVWFVDIKGRKLHRYGVDIEWQNFQHPVYTQHSRGSTDFVPRMAAIDLLVNAGPDSLRVLRQARSQH